VNDYAATIAISAPSGVAAGSAVNFPRLMAPSVSGITWNDPGPLQSNNTEFILPSVGVYRVSWHIGVNEAGQMSLFICTAPVIGGPSALFLPVTASLGTPGNVGRATGTSNIDGDVLVNNVVPGSVIQVRNFASAAALTVTPLPGGTQAQSAVLIIQRVA
jgi:hypothetical protein